MLIAYLIFASCAVFALVALAFYLAPGAPRPTSVPGPPPSDEKDGNLGDMVKAGSLHEYLEELHHRFGPIVSFWWGRQNVISVCTATFFRDQAKFFDRPLALFEFLEPLVSEHSLQFANGTDGKVRRSHYDRHFTQEACEGYMTDLLKIATEMAERWDQKYTGPGDHLPIHSFMTAYAIRSISKCCFGEMDHKDLVELSDEYVVAMDGLLRRWNGPTYPRDDPREQRFRDSVSKIKAVIGKVVQVAMDNYDREAESRPQGDGLKDESDGAREEVRGGAGDANKRPFVLLDGIVEFVRQNAFMEDPSKETKDAIILADAVSFFIGGFHTTANMLTWCLYYLASEPEVQSKLRSELVEVLGPDPEERSVTASNYSDLVYCRAVLDETLRCAKVAPMAARCSDVEHRLGPHLIPPCTPVIHALGVSMDDQEVFPGPENFDPERFMPENRDKRPALAFVPFGFAGKRKCPGFRFAYMESVVLLSVILRKFRLRLVDDELEAVPHFGFVTKPRDEIHVFVTKL